jgi:hypothetical protein
VPEQQYLRIHYIYPVSDGPLQSGPAGTSFVIGTDQRYQCACDPNMKWNHLNRPCHETFGVSCEFCEATEIFKKNYHPHPRDRKDVGGKPRAASGVQITGPCDGCK